MFWHLLITPIVLLFHTLYDALPPWTISLGSGLNPSDDVSTLDGGMLHKSLTYMATFDRYVPLHDGVLPIVSLALAFFVAMIAFKVFKFILSLIPTISAGG